MRRSGRSGGLRSIEEDIQSTFSHVSFDGRNSATYKFTYGTEVERALIRHYGPEARRRRFMPKTDFPPLPVRRLAEVGIPHLADIYADLVLMKQNREQATAFRAALERSKTESDITSSRASSSKRDYTWKSMKKETPVTNVALTRLEQLLMPSVDDNHDEDDVVEAESARLPRLKKHKNELRRRSKDKATKNTRSKQKLGDKRKSEDAKYRKLKVLEARHTVPELPRIFALTKTRTPRLNRSLTIR